MPYFAGGDVHSYLDNFEYLSEPVAFRIFHQLVDAVEHCHLNHVIHRDIKLENILIDSKDDLNVTLIDFGFSIRRRETDPLLDDYPGSPAYAAPELMQGLPYPGYSADVWAMGVSLYIMVTGEYPFWSENRKQMFQQITQMSVDFSPFPHVSAGCRELIESMLSKDWRNRPTVEQIRQFSWFSSNWQSVKPIHRSISMEIEPVPDFDVYPPTPKGPATPIKSKRPETPCTPMSGTSTPKSVKKEKWTPNFNWKGRKLVF